MGYLPTWEELAGLAFGSVGACLAGALVLWLWSWRGKARSFAVSVAALLIGCGVFGVTQYLLYRAADARWQGEVQARAVAVATESLPSADISDDQPPLAAMAAERESRRGVEARHLHIFLYGAAFALLPLWFLGRNLAANLSDTPLEASFAMNTMPGERGPFRKAQRLAQRGDIDGAVAEYRRAPFHHSDALLAAARLLQNDGRYDDSMALYREVMENYNDSVRVWCAAACELARIQGEILGEHDEAIRILGKVIERDPDGEHGHSALRLQQRLHANRANEPVADEALLAALDAQFEHADAPPKPAES